MNARQAIDDGLRGLTAAYVQWRETCQVLDAAPVDDIEEPLRRWAEGDGDACPVAVAVDRAYQEASRRLTNRLEQAAVKRERLAGEIETLCQERQPLLDGAHPTPSPPPTQVDAARRDRPGAPFYRLIDFQDHVGPGERAGLEAALEAAALLDAWVTPNGRIDSGDIDTFMDASLPTQPTDTPNHAHLGRMLRPCSSSVGLREAPAPQVVQGFLERISLQPVDGQTSMLSDGAWRNGLLRGRWTKPHAQFIGHAAREAERQRQIEALTARLDERQHWLEAVTEEEAALAGQQRDAQSERDRGPSDEGVRRAMADLASVSQQVAGAHDRVQEAATASDAAAAAAQDARMTLERDADDLGLRDEIDQLPDYAARLAAYRSRINDLFNAWERHGAATTDAESAASQCEIARQDLTRGETLHEKAERSARDAAVRRDTLEQAHGTEVQDILAALEQARRDRDRVAQRLQEMRTQREDTREAYGGHKATAEAERSNIEQAGAKRHQDITHLRNLSETDMLGVVLADDPAPPQDIGSPTAAIQLARRIEAVFTQPAEDDATWERTHNQLNEYIQTLEGALLTHDLRLDVHQTDGLWRLTTRFRGGTCDTPSLGRELRDEVNQRRTYLEQREREVLENTLVGEVANHLHQRLREGDQLVHRMNGHIESRPMSTGMRLRLKWEPDEDGPIGLTQARKRLIGTPGTWSPDDDHALGGFLQEQINRCREDDQVGSWDEHLARALDYRQWHSFVIERYQDDRWQRLTKRTHGTGSGGEKAVALTLPMFAAAAAHYGSAHEHAPRLIMLDEAFAGIDADMRCNCMGLLAEFDLDFVMTSEREWACYQTLPGVAIYQLSAHPGYDAVYASRWTWNGRELLEDGGEPGAIAQTAEHPNGDEPLDSTHA